MNITTPRPVWAVQLLIGSCLCWPIQAGAAELGADEGLSGEATWAPASAPSTVMRLAQAEEEAEKRARSLFENGASLYEEGRYEDAILAWEEGYRLSKRPLFLFNIANAQERLGKLEDALASLNRYRAFAPDEERDVLEKRVRNLEQRVKTASTPVVPPTGSPSAGETQVGAPAKPSSAPAGVSKPGTSPLLLPGVLLGAGVVGLGSGIASANAALILQDELKTLCVAQDEGWICPSDANDLLKAEASQARLSTVGYAAGTAFLLGGLVVGAWQLFLAPPANAVGWRVLPSWQPGRVAVSVTTHF